MTSYYNARNGIQLKWKPSEPMRTTQCYAEFNAIWHIFHAAASPNQTMARSFALTTYRLNRATFKMPGHASEKNLESDEKHKPLRCRKTNGAHSVVLILSSLFSCPWQHSIEATYPYGLDSGNGHMRCASIYACNSTHMYMYVACAVHWFCVGSFDTKPAHILIWNAWSYLNCSNELTNHKNVCDSKLVSRCPSSSPHSIKARAKRHCDL